jgi:CO/xanthine dehydrogenase Mo-binding subunit
MIKLEINRKMRTFDVTDDVPLLWALRDVAHMTPGVGEAGTAGVGAAFVNAIYAATGRRLYALPATPDLLKIVA